MQMTIGQALDKIDIMRMIVKEIEDGDCTWHHRANQIADFLDEYILILSNTKVNI